MQAYIMSEPGKGVGAWKKVEKTDPTPKASEVLIGVRATSLNYRDLLIAKGSYGPGIKENCIPLSDGAGEVLAVGENVSQFKVGDRVAGTFFQYWNNGPVNSHEVQYALGGNVDGMLAQKVVLSEHGVVKIPDHLSYEEAATLPCAAITAWNALMESSTPLKPGSTVLTLGTGGVSIFAVQFAKAAGLNVIGTSSRDDKIKHLKLLGVTDGINYKNNPEWQDAVLSLTNGQGVDHVVEVGGAGTLPRSFQAVRMGGTVSLIGLLAGATEMINPLIVLRKSIRLQGIYVGSTAMFKAMNKAIETHQIKPVIDQVFEFDQANEALAKLESGAHFGKIVIRIK